MPLIFIYIYMFIINKLYLFIHIYIDNYWAVICINNHSEYIAVFLVLTAWWRTDLRLEETRGHFYYFNTFGFKNYNNINLKLQNIRRCCNGIFAFRNLTFTIEKATCWWCVCVVADNEDSWRWLQMIAEIYSNIYYLWTNEI